MARCENCESEALQDNYCRGGDHFCQEGMVLDLDHTCGKLARFKLNYEYEGETWYFWVCAECYDEYYSDDPDYKLD